MATLPPRPSKRQKLAADQEKVAAEEAQRIPEGLGDVRVQFVDQASGEATGAPVSVSIAHANIKNLELLLNSLQGQVCKLPARVSPVSSGLADVGSRQKMTPTMFLTDSPSSLMSLKLVTVMLSTYLLISTTPSYSPTSNRVKT